VLITLPCKTLIVKKHSHVGCLLWRRNNPEVNYSPPRISGGGGGVSRGNTAQHDLQEVECWYMDWIGLAQYRDRWRTLVSAVMNLQVP